MKFAFAKISAFMKKKGRKKNLYRHFLDVLKHSVFLIHVRNFDQNSQTYFR